METNKQIRQIACGYDHSGILYNDKSTYLFGSNKCKQSAYKKLNKYKTDKLLCG